MVARSRILRIKGQTRAKTVRPPEPINEEKSNVKVELKNDLSLDPEAIERILRAHRDEMRSERIRPLWEGTPGPMQSIRFGNRRIRAQTDDPTPTRDPGGDPMWATRDARGHVHIGVDLAAPGSDETVTALAEVRPQTLQGIPVVVSEHVPKDQVYMIAGKAHMNAEGFSQLQTRLANAEASTALQRLSSAVRDLQPSLEGAARAISDAFSSIGRRRQD